jgi:hypothetical protein
MLGVQKFIFSMAAGVGPVFVLRWFWKRVNAWSQLSAMVSSLVLTIAYDSAYKMLPNFTVWIKYNMSEHNISYYPLKLVILTVIVTGIWLLVTFLTEPDDKEHLQRFYSKIKSRIYKKSDVVWKVVFLLLLPLITILPFVFVWSFKFYSIILGAMLFTFWIGMIWIVVLKMNKIYSEIDT